MDCDPDAIDKENDKYKINDEDDNGGINEAENKMEPITQEEIDDLLTEDQHNELQPNPDNTKISQ